MNELQKVFTYQGKQVRTIMEDGEPRFVAKDVCDVLELENVGQALSRLEDDEKNTIILNDGTPGNPFTSIVNEAGLYSLILSSRKKEAKAFKRWVTHDVLPAIRKTGTYSAPTQQLATDTRTSIMLKNANTRQATLMLKMAREWKDILSKESQTVLVSLAAETLTNRANLFPMPEINKTYSAGDLATEFGVTANRIGRLANKYGLKTAQYGITVLDKSAHSCKQVPAFRYNEEGRAKLRELLAASEAAPC